MAINSGQFSRNTATESPLLMLVFTSSMLAILFESSSSSLNVTLRSSKMMATLSGHLARVSLKRSEWYWLFFLNLIISLMITANLEMYLDNKTSRSKFNDSLSNALDNYQLGWPETAKASSLHASFPISILCDVYCSPPDKRPPLI